MKIDVNRVSAYLAGNFPQYYQSFPKIEFILLLNKKAGDIFEKNNRFDIIEKHTDSLQQFFSESLNLLKNHESLLAEIVEELKIPAEAKGSDFIQPKTQKFERKKTEEYIRVFRDDKGRFIKPL